MKSLGVSFKPCYKWNAFNTKMAQWISMEETKSFKPCYKWNAFNTKCNNLLYEKINYEVLNLVISGMPSILRINGGTWCCTILF